MEWNIVEHVEDGYIEIITAGVADGEGSMKMAKALADSMRTHQVKKAIIDHRKVDYIIGNTTAFNDRPKAFDNAGPNLGIKIAEIIRPEHTGHFKYLETVFENLGHKVSVFRHKDEALTWLLAAE
jgi:hypothetical protein